MTRFRFTAPLRHPILAHLPIILSGLLTLLLLHSAASGAGAVAHERYREPWRPQFHFTPATNWMNDPNGMVFYDGEYHLFYQFNPFGEKWGHMSWGHAVSRDLVRWEHLNVALYEENGVMIFSGSAVVDWKNTSGFGQNGKPPLVAIYTGHYTGKPLQNQQIAYSNDRGRTWTKYSGNPVLDLGEKDFRDPKVFWHEPTARWVMVVSWPTHRQIRFYASSNLKDWTHLSDFGPAGSTKGIWECPDLFPVSMENRRAEQKWVLVVNVGSDAPAGGSGCQYFVGSFDGKQFTSDASSKPGPALWADYGPDFYAAVSWSDVPKNDGRRLWLGWMSNWQYANDVPTAPWRSAMSVPRELTLRSTPDGLRLLQQPVVELRRQREKAPRHFRGGPLAAANEWLQRKEQSSLPELFDLELGLSSFITNSVCTLELGTGSDEHVSVVLDGARQRLTLDRVRSGKIDFHRAFAARAEAPLPVRHGRISLRLLVDTSSVEIFAQEGEAVITALFLPSPGPRHLRIVNAGNSTAPRIDRLQIHPLKSAW